MFGFGKRKCKECGAELAEMEAMRDRADDLMKSSALGSAEPLANICASCRMKLTKGTQSLAMNLHVIEARRMEAEIKPLSPTPAATSAPPKADQKPVYQPGGGYKTESEPWRTVFDEPNVDGLSIAKALFSWILGTKIGRNVGVGLFVFFVMIVGLISDNDEDYKSADEHVVSDAPSTFEPAVDETEQIPQPPAAPIATIPARPANNPGSWATTNDYPSRALNQGREGTTAFRLTVNTQGAVSDCTITQTSGHADLDAATCNAISKRARFERAPQGTPDRGYRNRVTWRIPAE